jgi:hypothetical protein
MLTNFKPIPENIAELFDYQDGKLFWRVSRRGTTRAGDEAGYLNSEGYVCIKINGKKYLAHRIIWTLHYGEIPYGLIIDHANGQKSNNRIENLRLVTYSENSRNRKICKKNSCGLKGIYFDKSTQKYRAQILVNGNRKFLGRFPTPQDAHRAYIAAANQYFGNFARAA